MEKILVRDLLEKVDEVPVFPEHINKILLLTEDKSAKVKDIEHEIMKDQGLATKMLKMANSAYYGMAGKVNSIEKAAILLGMRTIKSIILTATVGKLLQNELPGYQLKKESLWKQSQVCAVTARLIAKEIKYEEPDVAYTAGLVHDIGKVVLESYLRDDFEQVLKTTEDEHRGFDEVENELLGFSHADVGAMLAKRWHLPNDLIETIKFHHKPSLAQEDMKLVSIVHIADAIVMMLGIDLGVDGLSYKLDESVFQHVPIDEEKVMQIYDLVVDMIEYHQLYADRDE